MSLVFNVLFFCCQVIVMVTSFNDQLYGECGYKSTLYECPGTAINRINPIHSYLSLMNLNMESWADIRMELVGFCGLNNQTHATSHCFADYNHVDCCPIITSHGFNTNELSRIQGMHQKNQLGNHIKTYSISIQNDNNGSWCTCHIGTPKDVCHLQFGSMIAFKLIWCPEHAPHRDINSVNDLPSTNFMAMIIDNDGNVLNYGIPTAQPNILTKFTNWLIILRSSDKHFREDMITQCRNLWLMLKKEL